MERDWKCCWVACTQMKPSCFGGFTETERRTVFAKDRGKDLPEGKSFR